MDVSNSSVIKSRSRMKSGRKCRPQVDFSAGITSPLYAMEPDNMESVLPTKARSRLYELFGQIEKEFEALYVENLSHELKMSLIDFNAPSMGKAFKTALAVHTKVEALTDRLAEGGMPLEKAAEIFAITNEAVAGNKASSKKSTIQMGQKLKTAFKVPPGRNLVSSFKVGSDPNRVRYVRTFKGHRDGVWHVDAAKSNLLCSTSADQTARIWCIETGVCFAQYVGHEGSVNCARFNLTNNGNGDNILVVTASGDQSAHIWKAPTTFNQQQQEQQQQQTIGACHHSSEDEKCSDKEEIIVDESETLLTIRQPLLKLTGHTCPVIAADWIANDNQIVTASWDRTANVFDAERGEIVNILSGHDLELNYCCAHPSQKLVVTASRDTTFRLWDFRESIHSVSVFQGHTESVTSAVFTGADKIVSGSDDRSVKVWDFRNMRTALTTIRMDSPVNRIAISRTSNIIAIPTDNRQVRLYDLNGVRITRLPSTSRRGHHRMVCCCAWADDNSHCNLFSCGFDKQQNKNYLPECTSKFIRFNFRSRSVDVQPVRPSVVNFVLFPHVMNVRVKLKLILLTSVLVSVNSDVLLDEATDLISSRYPSGVSIQVRPFWLHVQNSIYHKSTRYTYATFRHLLYEKEDLKNYLNGRLAFRKLENAVLTHDKSPKFDLFFPKDGVKMWREYARMPSNTVFDNYNHSEYYFFFVNSMLGKKVRLVDEKSVFDFQNTYLLKRIFHGNQPFKIPCYVHSRDRLANGQANQFYRMDWRTAVKKMRLGRRVVGQSIHDMFTDLIENNQLRLSTIHHFEQPAGSHLADGGGYYLFVHAEQQPLVMDRNEDRMQQGVFYCASDDREDPEVLIFVDYSTKIHTSADLTTENPPEKSEAVWLNLEKFIHWSPWSSCCSASPEGYLFRQGHCAYRKLNMADKLNVPGTPGMEELDYLLTTAEFRESGIPCTSAMFREQIHSSNWNRHLPINDKIYVQSKHCEISELDLIECQKNPANDESGGEKSVEETVDTTGGQTEPSEKRKTKKPKQSNCPLCKFPFKHEKVFVFEEMTVEFKPMDNLILYCGHNETASSKHVVQWFDENMKPIKGCLDQMDILVEGNELHIHAITEQAVFHCEVKKNLVGTVTLVPRDIIFVDPLWLGVGGAVAGIILIISCFGWMEKNPQSDDEGDEDEECDELGRMQRPVERVKKYVAKQLGRNCRLEKP
ncbi:WD repeat-containing protein 37 [Trichinella zimbabwensis]|uniref:WD repeat-containing protein 37 n=1 Tax=Trichinella zimbabwensis TaxID=268475 RepID=A0A0V1HK83_9BILA|nr:WD repeat-containing protein 37 [Trichinella zimbabwensis]